MAGSSPCFRTVRIESSKFLILSSSIDERSAFHHDGSFVARPAREGLIHTWEDCLVESHVRRLVIILVSIGFGCRPTLPPLPVDKKWYPETPRGGVGSDFCLQERS